MVEEVRMFPRWFYKAGEEPVLCASEEDAAALGEGWSDEAPAATPAATPAPPSDEEEEEGGATPRRRR